MFKQNADLVNKLAEIENQHRADMANLKSRLTEQESLGTVLENELRKTELEVEKLKDAVKELDTKIEKASSKSWLTAVIDAFKRYFGLDK